MALVVPLLHAAAAAAANGSVECSELSAPAPRVNEAFGNSIAMSGRTAVAGTFQNPIGEQGHAYVMERMNDGSWVVSATLGEEGTGNTYGWNVDVDGRVVVVSDEGDAANAGAAYVYERASLAPLARWRLATKLTAHDASANARFANALAVSGGTIVVASAEANAGLGAIYLFRRHGSWREVATIANPEPAATRRFGQQVALDGDTLVVSAVKSGTCVVYVFESEPMGTFRQVARLTSGRGADGFGGYGLAVDGGTLAVGAFSTDGSQQDSGAVHLFERDPSGSWVASAFIPNPDGGIQDGFGFSLGLHGDDLAVGNIPIYYDPARLYHRSGGVWSLVAELVPADQQDPNPRLLAATEGGIVLLGRPSHTHTGPYYEGHGAVSVFMAACPLGPHARERR